MTPGPLSQPFRLKPSLRFGNPSDLASALGAGVALGVVALGAVGCSGVAVGFGASAFELQAKKDINKIMGTPV